MKPGDIYKARESRDDEWDRVQIGGFIPLGDDPSDFEISFTAIGGEWGFGETASTSAEEFTAAFKKVSSASEALDARLAALEEKMTA